MAIEPDLPLDDEHLSANDVPLAPFERNDALNMNLNNTTTTTRDLDDFFSSEYRRVEFTDSDDDKLGHCEWYHGEPWFNREVLNYGRDVGGRREVRGARRSGGARTVGDVGRRSGRAINDNEEGSDNEVEYVGRINRSDAGVVGGGRVGRGGGGGGENRVASGVESIERIMNQVSSSDDLEFTVDDLLVRNDPVRGLPKSPGYLHPSGANVLLENMDERRVRFATASTEITRREIWASPNNAASEQFELMEIDMTQEADEFEVARQLERELGPPPPFITHVNGHPLTLKGVWDMINHRPYRGTVCNINITPSARPLEDIPVPPFPGWEPVTSRHVTSPDIRHPDANMRDLQMHLTRESVPRQRTQTRRGGCRPGPKKTFGEESFPPSAPTIQKKKKSKKTKIVAAKARTAAKKRLDASKQRQAAHRGVFHAPKPNPVLPETAEEIIERRARALREGRKEAAKLNDTERRKVRRFRNRQSAERCRDRKLEEEKKKRGDSTV
eukprot:Plantae.Rhodophyta-Hildenbrandia_rubra.ctg695.p1 GENE.Plantae.Rhodophyta-Hildenbrandia_rubra.ctg695~~Plantae.Rhodophyta-Hildenbrandia_rubra.ctg695.p1  ORF type:complete len:500 (-),score=95.51 Plantae.Rhodophyta-Hildenbrandia_rubra.ctg695:2726-4225(-)